MSIQYRQTTKIINSPEKFMLAYPSPCQSIPKIGKRNFVDIDISDWDGVSPYQLMNDPYMLSQKPIFEAAPRALKYAKNWRG